jgi:hypothetical protein
MAEKRAGRTPHGNPSHRDEPVLLQEVRVDPSGPGYTCPSQRPLVRREDRRYRCPACGHNALLITRGPRRDGTGIGTFINCRSCGANQAGVAAASGIAPYRLLKWPPVEELGSQVGTDAVVPRIRVSEDVVSGCTSALWSLYHEHALAYLLDERGLTDATIRRWELGYDSAADAITIPVRDASNALLGIKRRLLSPPTSKDKVRNSVGLAALYPLATFDEDPPAVVLCEGELDALVLLQHGVSAVTTTTGTQGWDKHSEWAQWFVGRQVAVIYDAGSYALAAERANQLRREGAPRTWPVDLMRTGLAQNEDVTDWFVKYGRTAHELRQLIKNERRRSRTRRAA